MRVNDGTSYAFLSDIIEGRDKLMKPSNRKWPAVLAAGVIFFFVLVIPATGSDPYNNSSNNDGYGDFHKLFTDADDVDEAKTAVP